MGVRTKISVETESKNGAICIWSLTPPQKIQTLHFVVPPFVSRECGQKYVCQFLFLITGYEQNTLKQNVVT